MTQYDQERRLRVLRVGAYKCGVRERGILCAASASDVDALYRYPVCAEHAKQEQR